MRENRTQGSARGLPGNWQSYLDDTSILSRPQIKVVYLYIDKINLFCYYLYEDMSDFDDEICKECMTDDVKTAIEEGRK